jgi:predicted O-methyltransferase YrrM
LSFAQRVAALLFPFPWNITRLNGVSKHNLTKSIGRSFVTPRWVAPRTSHRASTLAEFRASPNPAARKSLHLKCSGLPQDKRKKFWVSGMTSFKSDIFQRTNFLLTALGLRRKGFYTPYSYLGAITDTGPPFPEVFDLFDKVRPTFQQFLTVMDAHESFYLNSSRGSIIPNWSSRFLSRLDGACIYSFVAHFKPDKIIEIGSGNSTVFMTRAIADHGLPTTMVCIDPQPRIAIDTLPVQIVRRALSIDDVTRVSSLKAGDILFVDSSHILQPDFDVDIIINRILPRLKPGVLVHFHDIFLPYPYPSSWKRYRFNEQNGLISWLLTDRVEPIFASHYVWREMQTDLAAICKGFPLNTPANGGSLWFRINPTKAG